ncbi:hypothetical protein INR49_024828 [Caranx melampygus]|nr:hypothetical protein INR49_024828 [Caranx melampygus]
MGEKQEDRPSSGLPFPSEVLRREDVLFIDRLLTLLQVVVGPSPQDSVYYAKLEGPSLLRASLEMTWPQMSFMGGLLSEVCCRRMGQANTEWYQHFFPRRTHPSWPDQHLLLTINPPTLSAAPQASSHWKANAQPNPSLDKKKDPGTEPRADYRKGLDWPQ